MFDDKCPPNPAELESMGEYRPSDPLDNPDGYNTEINLEKMYAYLQIRNWMNLQKGKGITTILYYRW